MPPKAAPKGRIAFLKVESSPFSNSRLDLHTGQEEEKGHQEVIDPFQGEAGRCAAESAWITDFQPLLYQELPVEFAITREMSVHPISRMPVDRLSLIKNRRGVMIGSEGGVRLIGG